MHKCDMNRKFTSKISSEKRKKGRIQKIASIFWMTFFQKAAVPKQNPENHSMMAIMDPRLSLSMEVTCIQSIEASYHRGIAIRMMEAINMRSMVILERL